MPVEAENGYQVKNRAGDVVATYTLDTAGDFLWGRITSTRTEHTTEDDFLTAIAKAE